MVSDLDVRERVLLLVTAIDEDEDELFRFFAIVVPLPIVDVSRFEKNNLLLVFPPRILLLSQQSPWLQIVNGWCRITRFLFPWCVTRNAVVVEAKLTRESELVRIVECAVIVDRKRIASIRVPVNERGFFIRETQLGWKLVCVGDDEQNALFTQRNNNARTNQNCKSTSLIFVILHQIVSDSNPNLQGLNHPKWEALHHMLHDISTYVAHLYHTSLSLLNKILRISRSLDLSIGRSKLDRISLTTINNDQSQPKMVIKIHQTCTQ